MKHRKSRGFSLIELLIVVVVISILATLAITSYGNYVRKARRADAKADILELAQLLERNYTETNTFTVDGAGVAITPASFGLTQSPQQGQAVYILTFPVQTATTYRILATAQGPQQSDTRCMNLTLDQAGVKGISGSGTVAECW
jgi:type IV pilus assembly protein PilE